MSLPSLPSAPKVLSTDLSFYKLANGLVNLTGTNVSVALHTPHASERALFSHDDLKEVKVKYGIVKYVPFVFKFAPKPPLEDWKALETALVVVSKDEESSGGAIHDERIEGRIPIFSQTSIVGLENFPTALLTPRARETCFGVIVTPVVGQYLASLRSRPGLLATVVPLDEGAKRVPVYIATADGVLAVCDAAI